MEIICDCGHKVTEDDIDYSWCVNEDGEEYTQFELACDKCFTIFCSGSDWGSLDRGEVIEVIQETLGEED